MFKTDFMHCMRLQLMHLESNIVHLTCSMCLENSSENCIEFLLVIVDQCQINDRPDESQPSL